MGGADMFYKMLVNILLLWLITVSSAVKGAVIKTHSNEIDSKPTDKIYVQTSDLVVKEKSGKPLVYHFITDYPHPHVPTNNYIKPWDVVASKPIRVKNVENAHSRILRKNNILYLAKPHEYEEK
ncbi:hypothetical protein DOY81_004520 [Sarcophaga bullata]|nr:hypothetical protein DOY81_004520 [Sarcophaga bullata]